MKNVDVFVIVGQVSTENFSKFQLKIKPQRDLTFEDMKGGEVVSSMCLTYVHNLFDGDLV